jgi:hypothetical protein
MHSPQPTFKNFKERGEWVELFFMTGAALHGYHVLKPSGDCLPYDVGIEQSGGLLRVQVKSTSACKGRGGYLCRLRHGGSGEQRYDLNEVDLFALYIMQAQVWYLIPAHRVLNPTPKMHIRFYPDGLPRPGRHTRDHDYERYREAWGLLGKSRQELATLCGPEGNPEGRQLVRAAIAGG